MNHRYLISRSLLRKSQGFTLAEMMVAVSVIALLMAFIGQVLSSSSALVLSNYKHMDADAQARGMLDRLAIDLGRIVKRSDASLYLKNSISAIQTGNDQLAFFSEVPGYASGTPAPIPASPSSVSLVGYRINSTNLGAERLGKGLIWNGAQGANTPMVFLPRTIQTVWPQATTMDTDVDYEATAPGVFRFEYYYLLKGQTLPDGTQGTAILSDTPWDTRMGTTHASENGLCDVAAIGVVIAVVDPASRNIVSNPQLTALAGQMKDFAPTVAGNPVKPGDLETQWMSVTAASSLPHGVSSAIRVYGRMFYIPTGNK